MTESPQITRAVIRNLIVEMRQHGLDHISIADLERIIVKCDELLAVKARR